MNRKGYIYQRMEDWSLLVEAERVAVKGKAQNKGEAHRMAREIERFLLSIGFRIHTPKIRPLKTGLNFLGYVTYPGKGMFWRTSDKKAWLRRRKHITNPKRLAEIDGSAWGFISHGNKHCKRLYNKMNGVSFSGLGLRRKEQTDTDGRRIIDAQQINMQAVLGRPVIVKDIVPNIKTSHGEGRMALLIEVFGQDQKLIVNAQSIKTHMEQMLSLRVTRHETVFIDRGGRRYDIDLDKTRIIEIDNRPIGEGDDGKAIFLDTKEEVSLT